jgi:predicted alpha/beta-hydrolase family hydrolase
MLAADEPGLADALLLLSYPLHPPRQPDKLRTDHFPRLNTPAVFVHGTIDPFATPQELEAATALIPAPTRLIVIERGGHDLKRGRVELGPAVSAMFEARRA